MAEWGGVLCGEHLLTASYPLLSRILKDINIPVLWGLYTGF